MIKNDDSAKVSLHPIDEPNLCYEETRVCGTDVFLIIHNHSYRAWKYCHMLFNLPQSKSSSLL